MALLCQTSAPGETDRTKLFVPSASSCELTAGRGHRCRVSVRQARTVSRGGGGRDDAVTVRTKEMVGESSRQAG